MGMRSTLIGVLLCSAIACGDDDASTTPDATVDATIDANTNDAAADASALDANAFDANAFDANASDANLSDARKDDADVSDAGDGGVSNPGYALKLSETGLYQDIENDVLADGVVTFAPAYPLWSDGASKRRFLYLPPGESIDTSDMDRWVFPVGTKAWKEFTRDGVRVETRLIEKRDNGFLMLAYVWNEANTDADVTLLPIEDARGTDHDVPSRGDCLECHGGQPDRLLGVSAIQLSHDGTGLTLAQLISDQRLSQPPAGPFVLPGDALDQATLGMLHANCGNCHVPGTNAFERADGMQLWLTVDRLTSVADTWTYQSTVGIDLTSFERDGFAQRVVPGEPMQSALWFRMGQRGDETQMPPMGTELPDTDGVDRLNAWIDRLN